MKKERLRKVVEYKFRTIDFKFLFIFMCIYMSVVFLFTLYCGLIGGIIGLGLILITIMAIMSDKNVRRVYFERCIE